MKTRMIKMGLVLTAIMFAVGLVGCPNDGGNPAPTPPAGQKNAFISRATIGNAQAGFVANQTSKLTEVLDSAYQGYEELQAASSAKNLQLVVVKASGSDKATVQMAVIKALNATPAFVKAAANTTATSNAPGTARFNAPSGGFDNGDFVLLKVTSQDGSKVNYYRANVSLGLNATLVSVTIGFTDQIEETWLGKPAAALASVTEGTFRTDPITNKSIFKIVPADDEATVSYAFASVNTAVPSPLKAFAEFDNGVLWSTINTPDTPVNEGDYLFIKVEPSASTGTPLFYVMKIEFPMVGSIKYGTPQIIDPANPGAAWYEDPVWGTDWTYDISRFNLKEDYPAWFKTEYGQHTVAKAKVLWDEDGIWVLADVTFNKYKTSESGAELDRRISTGAEHEADSLEVFINERFQILDPTDHKDIGDQYRVGTLNQRTGRGAGFSPATDISDYTTAGTTGFGYTKSRTVLKKADGTFGDNLVDATNGGYRVIVQAPFKYKISSDASDVFDSSGNVKPNAQIGLELQLNTAAGSEIYGGGRDGILTWNGVNTMAYSNATGYGIATLEPKPAAAPTVAAFPKITAASFTHLASKSYLAEQAASGVTALSITATETPTYQWYIAAGPTGAGVAATGPDNATDTYKPVIGSTLKDEYYYAIITNAGTRVSSPRMLIRTVGTLAVEDEWVINNPKIEIVGSNFTVNPDGSITATTIAGGGSAFGYKFPTFPATETNPPVFTKVVFDVTVSNIETGKLAKVASKNGYLVTTPDCTSPGYPQWSTAQNDTTQLTYNIIPGVDGDGAPLTGNNAALYTGAVTWQMNDWNNDSGTFTIKFNKATFTVAGVNPATVTSFYVNLGGAVTGTIPTPGSQWPAAAPVANNKVGGGLEWVFDQNNQRGYLPFTELQYGIIEEILGWNGTTPATAPQVTIEFFGGSFVSNYEDNEEPPAPITGITGWRHCIIDSPDTGNGWDVTTLVNSFGPFDGDGKYSTNIVTKAGATEKRYFLLQARSTGKTAVNIDAVKVSFTRPVAP